MSHRSAYTNSVRKLVLAFDVGTTYSGISYSILDPGQMPSIKGVTRFPAQEHIMGASKIPTIIYYDQKGKVRAVGAEAMREGIEEEAEDGNWVKAEWFKLHLRSKSNDGRDITRHIPPLPPKKTVAQVWADFLRYLLECAQAYIQETYPNGPLLWASVCDHIDFVLSHPNGWEGKEQGQMRQAAVLAGLVPDTQAGHARVSFVTEGEASLHFAIENGVLSDAMKGNGVVIVDAGGGTIDISSYKHDITQVKRSFEEIAAPQCHLYGSVFVSIHAKMFLEKFLSDSSYLDDLEHMVHCFDTTTKIRFRNAEEPQYVKFGSTRDNDASCNIRFGQIKLTGADVAGFFRPSANCIVTAVLAQRKLAHSSISQVVLVGGFAANDWLFEEVRSSLINKSLNVIRPTSHVNKAVSDGALSFYLDHFVRTRVSKFTYGSFGAIIYDNHNPDHRRRQHKKRKFPSGDVVLPDHFTTILPKNTQVSEKKEFTEEYYEEYDNPSRLQVVESEVWCYRGALDDPRWKDQDPKNYKLLCTIKANLSKVPKKHSRIGKRNVYRVDLQLVLLFGLTEMQAQIAWDENGSERRCPARIVYEP